MKTAAVICEFNPLHNGHARLISLARETLGADNIICIMSGDFVQRGEPAVFSKYVRAKAALASGADIVLELPVKYSAAAAPDFAYGGVSVADALGCVDMLVFGTEGITADELERLADFFADESADFSEELKLQLREGLSYPAARQAAFEKTAPESLTASFKKAASPNGILALEYCVALKKLNSSIRPAAVTRNDAGYHSKDASGSFASATAIRQLLFTEGLSSVRCLVPEPVFEIYENAGAKICPDDLSLLLKYKLLGETADSLSRFSHVDADLACRIKQCENSFTTMTGFAALLKTRNITYTRVMRALLCILLDITPGSPSPEGCVRALGLRRSSPVSSLIKEKARIELVTRPSLLKNKGYETDLFASSLYESIAASREGRAIIHEYTRPVIIL